MAEPYVELTGEAVNYIVDKHWDRVYDKTSQGVQKVRVKSGLGGDKAEAVAVGVGGENVVPVAPAQSAVSRGSQRKHVNSLPSPEPSEHSIEAWVRETARASNRDSRRRDRSIERQSETSERVISAYESERHDPKRKPESVLSRRDLDRLRRDRKMSYANYGNNQQQQRPQSAGPRTRYYDDDDSDYDEKSGRRYRASGRGYEDDDYDDDRGYDREVVTTERYKGVSNALVVRQHLLPISKLRVLTLIDSLLAISTPGAALAATTATVRAQ